MSDPNAHKFERWRKRQWRREKTKLSRRYYDEHHEREIDLKRDNCAPQGKVREIERGE